MASYWKIVGGEDKGGILVRQGKALTSPQEEQRLSYLAVVKELEFDAASGRLNYEVVTGTGPRVGWVSIKLTGKELAVRTDAPPAAAAEPELPPEVEEDPPEGMTRVQWRIHQRCRRELAKEVPAWKNITVEQVQANHTKKAPGMLYGLEFPWTEEMLHSKDYGAAWLTKAFHMAGTIPRDNRVTRVIPEKSFKITTGNNGGKFLFEVEYLKTSEDLHTKLFAKIPHSMEGPTFSDRLSSSVNKQPMELYELNSSRLLEATLPVKIPRFYFGDISNETSNWILITEAVNFAKPETLDFAGKTRGSRPGPLKPLEIEGPYDKCMDWTLRGDPAEYYTALVRSGARMAGLAKSGKFGDPAVVAKHFENFENVPKEMWGMQPGCSGQPPKQLKPKIDAQLQFFADTGKMLFPEYSASTEFQDKFRKAMMMLNAYFAEANWWSHQDLDYVALTHNNMNVDNAYFWRDEAGNLDLGVFDWGSMGSKSLGSKLWWWLYCGEFETLNRNMDGYLTCFVDTYAEFGGPRLDKEVLRTQFVLAAMQQMFGLAAAMGQVYKMCPKKEWATIKDRYDSRIGENIHGKSTLRLYLQVMNTIVQMVQEWKVDELIENWTADVASKLGMPKKDASTMEA